METQELFDFSQEGALPFKFRQSHPSQDQIKNHWLQILEKIAEQEDADSDGGRKQS